MPLALVTAVLASNALSPNAELTLTMKPAPTGAPAPSFTVNVSVAGASALTFELLAVIFSVGVSASNCTTSELCVLPEPKVAAAVSVSAAEIEASATLACTLAMPPALVIAEGALNSTRLPADAKETMTFGTTAPLASLNTALKVAAPVEPRKVVELIVKPMVETLPATVKLANPCTEEAPILAIPTT